MEIRQFQTLLHTSPSLNSNPDAILSNSKLADAFQQLLNHQLASTSIYQAPKKVLDNSYLAAMLSQGRPGTGVQNFSEIQSTADSAAVSKKGSFESFIEKAASQYGIDAKLIRSVIKAESNFNPDAVSHAGAQGLMQLMPATARGLGVTNSFDPEQNVMGGSRFLKQMLERYNGNTSLALAAYNAGPGNVDKFNGIPPFKETQNYVRKVMDTYQGLV